MLKNRVSIGPRTLKTAAAVILSMVIVEAYGATTSRLIFATLGAMNAVQPTFKASIESSLTQIVGVILGALAGVCLQMLPIDGVVAAGVGIILVITIYNTFRLRFSPGLPCLIVVTICTTPGILPMEYALGRIWDTAIGLAVGMAINTLVFPYDNRRQIRDTVRSLDHTVIVFLEEMFDGDEILPDPEEMTKLLSLMAQQMEVFSQQRLLRGRRQVSKDMESFRLCEIKARELLARMTVLSHVGRPGRLNEENRKKLRSCGANIRDERPLDAVTERDVVTNYHVRQILKLRRELLDHLGK